MANYRRYMACYEQKNNGVCDRLQCPFSHDLRTCSICEMVIVGQVSLDAHVNGKKHAKAVSRESSRLATPQSTRATTPQPPLTTPAEQPQRHCTICDRLVPLYQWESHPSTKAHQTKTRYVEYQQGVVRAEADKHNVVVSVENGVNFGIVSPTSLPITKKLTIITAVDPAVHLRRIWRTTSPKTDRALQIEVTFDPKDQAGILEERIDLRLGIESPTREFIISRTLRANVGDPELYAEFKPKTPCAPKVINRPIAETEPKEVDVVDGPKPPDMVAAQWARKLPRYDIPSEVAKANVDDPSLPFGERRKRAKTLMPDAFSVATHGKFFHRLLHFEEVQERSDMRSYDRKDVTITPSKLIGGGAFKIDVPGLAEKRPSVLRGDAIRLRTLSTKHDDHRWYRGYVIKVELAAVFIRFDSKFKWSKYELSYEIKRTTHRRMHAAVLEPILNPQILFPSVQRGLLHGEQLYWEDTIEDFRPINRKLETNPPQKRAVIAMRQGLHHPAPFVLFGPPGTGKTVTIVEAMLQIIATSSNAKILACAPSNSAADLLALRLPASLPQKTVFRLNAISREPDAKNTPPDPLYQKIVKQVPPKTGPYVVPDETELAKYRIVVCTCLSAILPASHGAIGLPKGHFTHVFIDEAGQATEPEALVALKMNGSKDMRLILAGDPKQLGPILRSHIAKSLGLEKSMLDRIMSLPLYVDLKDWRLCVKLTQNFRSHPAILKFPNERFYNTELVERADPLVTHSLNRWDGLPRPGFPILFRAVKGEDTREGDSPSFFNLQELSVVESIVKDLCLESKVRPQDIGIIAPYQAQVFKLRRTWIGGQNGLKVGSVEEFQGQERRVIILTTVRSNKAYLEHDSRFVLGFLNDPRRFNVAVTRAQALLIVVGDPETLGCDALFRSFINYVYNAGGYKGVAPSWDTKREVVEDPGALIEERRDEAMNELEALVSKLNLSDEQVEAEAMAVQAEQPWRRADE